MGLILAHCGFQRVLVVFGHFTFYRLFQGAIYGVGLIFSYMLGLITGDFRLKTIFVIFNLLSADFFGGGAGGFYFVGAVHALGEGDFGFVFWAVIGFAHNAVSEIFGDGEGFGTISYSNLSFACILADDGVLVLSVHCCVYHGEGAITIANHVSGDVLVRGFWFCVIAQVLADFIGADLGDAGGVYRCSFVGSGGNGAAFFIENRFCRVFHTAGGFLNLGCHIALIDIGIVEWFASQSHVVGCQAAGDFQILGSDFPSGIDIVSIDIVSIDISCGCDGAAACIQISTLQGQAVAFNSTGSCIQTIAGNFAIRMNGTAGFNITTVNFTFLRIQAGAGNGGAGNCAAADGSALGIQAGAGNGGAGNGAAADGAGAGIDNATAGLDFTAIGIYAAIGCYFAVCIDFKIAIGPSDFPFNRIQGSFCSTIVIIASGVETVFIHGSTVLAYFDAIFVHGNLIITLFIQHQLGYRRGCGAVFSGNFGNHAVVAHFEVILVGRFASSCFSCHCIGIGFDMLIQGG